MTTGTLRVVNTTGIGRDTKIMMGDENITGKLQVEKIEIEISADDVLRARLTCWVDCDLAILPENVTVVKKELPK